MYKSIWLNNTMQLTIKLAGYSLSFMTWDRVKTVCYILIIHLHREVILADHVLFVLILLRKPLTQSFSMHSYDSIMSHSTVIFKTIELKLV
jgi:hypothetical protein